MFAHKRMILENINIRKAMNYAINRYNYVKVVTNELFFSLTRLVLPMVASEMVGPFCFQR